MVELRVDCKKKKIVLVCKIWDGGRIGPTTQKRIRDAVNQIWNRTPPLKYANCTVTVELEFSDAAVRPEKFDEWQLSPVPDPAGGGATGFQGDNSPLKFHRTVITPLPNGRLKPSTVAHELGHGMGLDDGLRGAIKWDKDGIKDEHVERIIELGGRDSEGRWLVDTRCCRGAVRFADVDRVDDEGLSWTEDHESGH